LDERKVVTKEDYEQGKKIPQGKTRLGKVRKKGQKKGVSVGVLSSFRRKNDPGVLRRIGKGDLENMNQRKNAEDSLPRGRSGTVDEADQKRNGK